MFRANVEETAEEMHPGHSTEPSEPGIALALGGGVAPGWAHIGVIRALEEAEIPIKMIAGTSIGALVGGCYLAGKLDELVLVIAATEHAKNFRYGHEDAESRSAILHQIVGYEGTHGQTDADKSIRHALNRFWTRRYDATRLGRKVDALKLRHFRNYPLHFGIGRCFPRRSYDLRPALASASVLAVKRHFVVAADE